MTARSVPTLLHVGRRQHSLPHRLASFQTTVTSKRSFRGSAHRRAEHFPDHYNTLGLAANSTPAEIKRQFYQLSKSNHPDLHPNDPEAAQRFVKISEAYAVLGAPEKRAQYDRDYQRATMQSTQSSSSTSRHPGGSFSSASTPAGGRPASGLSRRRTQFRGPPPSFYRNGAWGQYSDKRSAAAAAGDPSRSSPSDRSNSTSGSPEEENHPSSTATEPGTGPAGFSKGLDNDVPHFDHMGHFQTHSDIERTRHRARRKSTGRVKEAEVEREAETGAIGVMFNFLAVTGVLALVVSSGFLFGGLSAAPSAEPRRSTGQGRNGQGG